MPYLENPVLNEKIKMALFFAYSPLISLKEKELTVKGSNSANFNFAFH